MSDAVLVVKRSLSALPEAVFSALTDPAIMAQWFFAGADWSADVSGDPRVGGAYTITMHAPDGRSIAQWGEYREIDPPDRLVFTWSNDLVQDTVVTVELTPRGRERTDLVLYHALPDEAQIHRMHRDGWAACIAGLERYLGTSRVRNFESERRAP